MATAELALSLSLETPGIGLYTRFKDRLKGPDLAMDLGTANTLVYARGRGIILNEPSMIAVNSETRALVAVGKKARDYFGKTAQTITCVRPMKDGVIADFDMTRLMIQSFLTRVRRSWISGRPKLVAGVPSEITQVEKRAVIEAAQAAGCSDVYLVEEPMAAALGGGLPVAQRNGSLIVDIGGGTTDVAVLGMNSTFYSHCIRVAGDEMDEAIQRCLRRRFGMRIGILEAERIKLQLGSALEFKTPRSTFAHGIDIASGFPKKIEISDDTVRDALREPLEAIVHSITAALEGTSTDIAHDVVKRGGALAGGGTLLHRLPEYLTDRTGIKFTTVNDPLTSVVRGVGTVLENLKSHRSLCIS